MLTGCHEPWRRQRPNSDLLTRPDWHRLLPLVAHVQHQQPKAPLAALLTDRVASARSLPAVLAWRLWHLLRQPPPQDTRLETPSHRPTPRAHITTNEDTTNWHQHREAVRTIGGPAAVRAALATVGKQPPH